MQEQTVLRLFKATFLTIGLTVISPIWAAHGMSKTTALRCNQIFQPLITKTYLSLPDRAKISEITAGVDSKTYKVSQLKNVNNVHPWAVQAFNAYRDARLSTENFTQEQMRDLNQLKPKPASGSEVEMSHQQIKLPNDYVHSVMAYFIAAHELEHRIQYARFGSLGLDEDFIEYFMRIDVYRLEAEAMRAEWEFANALSPEAGDILIQMAKGNALSQFAAARNLSLDDYLKLNHELKRYGKSEANRSAEKVRRLHRENLSRLPRKELVGIAGEWRIPRTSLRGPLEFYRHYLASALPTGFHVELVPESDEVIVLKITGEPLPDVSSSLLRRSK